MTAEETNVILKDIHDRVQALPVPLTEEQVRQIAKNVLEAAQADPEAARKMKFGKPDPALVGGKLARHNLTVQDIEYAYDLFASRQESGMGPGPSEELRNSFNAVSKAVYMDADEVRRIDMQAIDGMYPRVPRSEFRGKDAALIARGGESAWQETSLYQRLIRAMDTAESGYGSQLIGAQYVANLWEAATNKARVFPLLSSFEMTAPTAYLPVEVDFPEMFFVGESTAADSSSYGTAKTGSNRVQVDAKKFVIHQVWSGEMEEDSILPFVPFLRRQTEGSLAYYSDSAVVNGDNSNTGTGNINCDDANPADTKHYLAFDGIRHACIIDNTNNATNHAGAVTLDSIMNLRKLSIDATYMHDWGHPNDPKQWVYLCDPWTGDYIDTLDDFISVDKFALNAVVLTGQVGRIGQNPLIRTVALHRTETDGKENTAGSTTCGQVLAFNPAGCVVGWRRRVRTETERLPSRDQTRIIHSLRMGFGRYSPTGAVSGIEWAALLYDITGV